MIMKTFIKQRLRNLMEDVHIPKMRLTKNVDISDEDKIKLKNLKWEDIKIDEVGNDGHSIIHLKPILPFENNFEDYIILDIQLINDELYQLHISIMFQS